MISGHIEKQFKGRILLLPPVSYEPGEYIIQPERIISYWIDVVKKGNFKFIIFLGTERIWQEIIKEMGHHYILCEPTPLLNLEDSYKNAIVEHQVQHLLKKIVDLWIEE